MEQKHPVVSLIEKLYKSRDVIASLYDADDILIEQYYVNEGGLARLDMLEGYRGDASNFYDRTTVETSEGTALIYFIPGIFEDKDYERVTSGDWAEFLAEKQQARRTA